VAEHLDLLADSVVLVVRLQPGQAHVLHGAGLGGATPVRLAIAAAIHVAVAAARAERETEAAGRAGLLIGDVVAVVVVAIAALGHGLTGSGASRARFASIAARLACLRELRAAGGAIATRSDAGVGAAVRGNGAAGSVAATV